MSRPASPPSRPQSLHEHAERELRTIRRVMQRAGSFTALPGWAGIGMGAIGLLAAAFAMGTTDPDRWLQIWLSAAAFAVPFGAWMLHRQAQIAGVDLRRGPARLFVFSLAPPILAGAVLTTAAWSRGATDLLPAVWLLLYGVATLAAGTVSLRLVATMGAGFVALGIVAAFLPLPQANLLLGAGFGGLHLIAGIVVLTRGTEPDREV